MVSLRRLDTKNYVDRFSFFVSELSVNWLLKLLKLAVGAGKAQAVISYNGN